MSVVKIRPSLTQHEMIVGYGPKTCDLPPLGYLVGLQWRDGTGRIVSNTTCEPTLLQVADSRRSVEIGAGEHLVMFYREVERVVGSAGSRFPSNGAAAPPKVRPE